MVRHGGVFCFFCGSCLLLRQAWAVSYVKKEQRSAILAVYQGRDIFVCLPTGYGKSVCYQCMLPFLMYYKHKEDAKSSSRAIPEVVVGVVKIIYPQPMACWYPETVMRELNCGAPVLEDCRKIIYQQNPLSSENSIMTVSC